MMLMRKWILVFMCAAVGLAPAVITTMFEAKPRIVATGRDPMIAVRASGALSLSKVENGDLWVQTSTDGGDSFEPPVRVNDVRGEVSSHPESSPQMQVRTRSEFYCLWQTRRGGDGSTLRFTRSMDWGESFQKAIDVDTTPGSTQSFYTMNVSPKGAIYAAWLDGRDRGKGRPGTSAVYLARSSNKGASFEKAVRVALDVCPCCRPNIAFGRDGKMHLTWRAVLEGNVRDIFVATSGDEGASWSPGVRVAEDNWVLNGCPHSGASMASTGKRLFIVWHAVREKLPALSLAYSDDGGKTFSRRIPVSNGVLDPNHPFLNTIGDRLALVFQGRPAGRAQGWAPVNVYYREVDAEARLSPLQTLGQAGGSASYPVFAFEEPERIYVAWTEPNKEGKAVVLSRGRRSAGIVQGVKRAAN
jgi:hypothetical protein